jgi:peptide/nickel transport system substrate-binding protein
MKDEKEGLGDLSRREFLYLSGLGMAGMSLAGIPELGHGAEEKPKYGGRLRICGRMAPVGLDAHRNQDLVDYTSYCLIYGALTEQGKLPDLEIYPMLAKSWEISKDGREYIFLLREGVKFHHGKELDSGDVKYSFERVLNPATRSPRAFALRWIDSVNIIDKYHVKIRLKESFAPFLSAVSLYNCPIIPAGWEPTGTKPAPGTGPYTVKSFVPNEAVEFSRFDQYWEYDEKTGNRLPYLDTIYRNKIVEEAVRWTALRAGDVDVVDTPPLNIVAKAILEKPVPGILIGYENLGNLRIFFNTSKPPFDNKKVRQAIAYGLDKKKALKAVFWGLGEVVNNQPYINSSRFYIPVEDREVDLAKAKQLMAEAGYPNGFKTEFLEFSLSYDVAGAEFGVGELKKLGIEATINVIDRAPFYSMMRKGEYSISFRGSAGGTDLDWDDAYYMHFHSNQIGKNNWTRYSNKELDELLEKGRTTVNREDRRSIYKKVIEILREDVPVLYLYQAVVGYALRDYVKGFREGFGVRPGWHDGGAKYWWLDK